MTSEQAVALLGLTTTLIDTVMFCAGVVAALIFASTWRG